MYYTTASIYLTGSAYPQSLYQLGADSHGGFSYTIAPSVGAPTRWTVAKNASASISWMTGSGVATVFTTTQKPSTAFLPATNGPGWVFGPYAGVFPLTSAATMSLQIDYWASTVSSQAGRLQYLIWKANDAAGTGASLITPTVQTTNIITVNATGNRVTSNFPLTSSLIMRNEYIIIVAAWAITTASGANNSNVIFRAGSGSFFKTGPFEDNTVILTGGEGLQNG